MTALLSSLVSGPPPCLDTSSNAVSKPTPARKREAICLKKSGVDCSIASTLFPSLKRYTLPLKEEG